jgi:hypothetical protein
MKVKEIDFASYEYKRLSIYHINSDYFPQEYSGRLVEMYGDEEVEQIEVTETGLLVIYTTIKEQ